MNVNVFSEVALLIDDVYIAAFTLALICSAIVAGPKLLLMAWSWIRGVVR